MFISVQCNPVTENQVIVGAYAKGVPMVTSEIRTIRQRIMHPDYNVDTWNYDVMLLKLDAPVNNIQKVALNNDDAVPRALSTVTPLGLGRLAEVDGEFPKVLQEVNVRVIDSGTCNKSPMYQNWIQDSMICAGVSGGGQDACFGDSGGPLIQKDLTTGELVQVGVVSFGTGCARMNKPGVYHRVSSSYDWIQEQICTYSSNKPSTCPGEREAVIEEQPIQQEQQQQQQQQQQPQQQQEQQQQSQTLNPTQVRQEQPQQQEQEQQEEEGVFQLYTHPENPPPLPLGMCEGDCDRDSDCADGLYCFYKTKGVAQTIPGCEGNDLESTDFCVDEKYRNSSSNPARQSIFSAQNGLGGSLRGSSSVRVFGQRTRGSGIIEGAFQATIP
jgi:hypothetical protein